MKSLLKPRPGWLVIRPQHLKYEGMAVLPDNVEIKESLQKAVVVETGYPDVAAGDLILYKTHAGIRIKLSDDNLLLVGKYDVVGVLNE